ncbi:sortase, partial [Anaerococcus octavius]|uniref:sortase n=1 Tax=Anaerococcus octavius TaxID=54007 RepID=UPI0027B96038
STIFSKIASFNASGYHGSSYRCICYETKYEKFTKTNTPFAYLSIPKLDKHLPLYLDASLDHISTGVAQVDGTSIPIGGAGTRSVIAGHRGWWTDTMFFMLTNYKLVTMSM